MIKKILFAEIFVFCFSPLFLAGQDYSYINYNTREGLAGSVVYSIAQDHDGFLWFSTETGVSRFDGSRFKNFTTADGLPDNDVIKIFVDSKNRVWFLPFKNTVCYYWRGKIYNAENDAQLGQLRLKQEGKRIIENAAGDILIMEMQGVAVLRRDGKLSYFDNMNGIPMVAGFWLGMLDDGKAYLVASFIQQGLYMFEVTPDSLKKIKFVAPTGNQFQLLYYSSKLEVYRDIDRVKIIDRIKSNETYLPIPDQYNSLNVLNDSLIAFNSSGVEIYNVRTKNTEHRLLQGKNVSSVFKDRENNLWLAMQGEGVYKLSSLEFKNYFRGEEQNSPAVFSLLKCGDTLYAGSSGLKVWTINTKTGSLKVQVLDKSRSLGRVITLNKLPDGSLLAGSDHALMWVKTNDIDNAKDVYAAVKSVYMSGDTIIVGQSIGVLALDAHSLRTLDTVLLGRTTAVSKIGYNYYIGTLAGLYIKDSRQKQSYYDAQETALKGKVAAMCSDAQGNVWVATGSIGVVGFNDDRIFSYINKDSGLSSNICRSIFANGNDLWIGTVEGLNKVTRRGNRWSVTRYTVSDGLVSDIINAVWVDGTMVYVATPKGISFFDESKVMTNSMCELKITAVQSPAQRFPFDTSGVIFPYNDRDIRIEFSGISFRSSGEIKYSYRLLGLHDEWQQTSDNSLNYAALPSGSYKLELQATNKFGVKSDVAKLAFIIEKPFWEKNWFRLLVVILFGAGVWIFINYRIQSERKKQEQKIATNRKMAELEQMTLKAQMNPHFIFNSLHSIQQYVLDKDIRGANKFITDFARLIRLTLNISMQPKISLQDEVNYLSTYLELEKTRLEAKFNYAVVIDESINLESSYIPAMILQPHVENSIHHGVNSRSDREGFIRIRFNTEIDYIVCIIEDNGVGRAATIAMKASSGTMYKSKGMLLTQNRIELLNKNYEMPILSTVEDVMSGDTIAGTRVTIRFPLSEVKKPV